MKNAMSKASQTTWQTAISLYFGFKEPDCPLVFFFLITRKNKAFLFGFLLLLHIFLPAQSLYLNIFRRTFFFLCYFSSHLTLTSESFKLKKRHNQKGCLASRIYLSASGVRILMDRDGAMNAETYCQTFIHHALCEKHLIGIGLICQ